MEGRYEADLTAVDPVTLEIKKSLSLAYPNYSGTLASAGELAFLDCWTAQSSPMLVAKPKEARIHDWPPSRSTNLLNQHMVN